MEHQDSTEPSSKETIQTQKPENIISGIDSGYLGQMFFDRTDYIPLLIGGPRVKIITAPSVTGKSCLCSMMSNFLSIRDDWECSRVKRYEIFKQLTIGKNEKFVEKHFGKYPVIRLDLYFTDNNYEGVLRSLRSAIHCVHSDHLYLSNSNMLRKDQKRWIRKWSDRDRYHDTTERDIIGGLKNLTECLRVHHGEKCYILLDGICNRILCYISSEDLNKFCKLLNSVMSCLLQENEDNIAGGIVTGRSLLFYGDWPCFKNVACYRFLHDHEFQRYFVFSEDEVSNLLIKYKEDVIEPDLTKIRKHYGGYVTKSGIQLYHPRLIWRYVTTGSKKSDEYPTHWACYSNVTTMLMKALYLPFLRRKIFDTLCGVGMRVNLLTTISEDNLRSVNEALRDERLFLHMDHNIALSYLLDKGFFTLDHALTGTDATGKINHFVKMANHNMKLNFRGDFEDKRENKFSRALCELDEPKNLKLNMENFLLWLYNKLYDGPPENSCNVTTLTELIAVGVDKHFFRCTHIRNAKIKVHNEKTNTYITDYVDVAFKYRKTNALIVKIGVGKSAEICARQMRDNNHLQVLQEFDSMKNVRKCLVLALTFSTLEDEKKVVFDGLYQIRDASDLSPLEIDKMESVKLTVPYWSK